MGNGCFFPERSSYHITFYIHNFTAFLFDLEPTRLCILLTKSCEEKKLVQTSNNLQISGGHAPLLIFS